VDVVREVKDELRERVDDVVAAGVPPECIVVDPGLGFAKTAEHNWALLARLEVLLGLGRPLLVGASRKSFLGALLADETGPRPTAGRDDATAAVTAMAALAGAWGVRVHDVRASADAVRVVARLRAETTVALS
jgi:dihydropteroate synthase